MLSLTFDPTPRGYETHESRTGVCSGCFGCGCSTSLEPQFRDPASQRRVEEELTKMTKPQIREFLAAAGVRAWGNDKRDIVVQAVLAQFRAWYPVKAVKYGEVR